jgi:hypothetical protein
MKRLIVTIATLTALIFGSSAAAQSNYFGVRLGFPFLFGVQAGVDFEDFGLRGVAEGLYVIAPSGSGGIFNLSLDALARTKLDAGGSNAYAGLGFGYVGLGDITSSQTTLLSGFAVRLILGLELVLGRSLGVFIEAAPYWLAFNSTGAIGSPLPVVTIGTNFRF